MSARTDLAAAASSVEGLTGHPYVTSTTDPGTVWVRLDRETYPSRLEAIAHWQVVLVLPTNLAEAEEFADKHRDDLRDALTPHLVVTEVRNERFQIPDVGTLPVATLIGHREAD